VDLGCTFGSLKGTKFPTTVYDESSRERVTHNISKLPVDSSRASIQAPGKNGEQISHQMARWQAIIWTGASGNTVRKRAPIPT
jgi:hypothetical protein